jgi:transposase
MTYKGPSVHGSEAEAEVIKKHLGLHALPKDFPPVLGIDEYLELSGMERSTYCYKVEHAMSRAENNKTAMRAKMVVAFETLMGLIFRSMWDAMTIYLIWKMAAAIMQDHQEFWRFVVIALSAYTFRVNWKKM